MGSWRVWVLGAVGFVAAWGLTRAVAGGLGPGGGALVLVGSGLAAVVVSIIVLVRQDRDDEAGRDGR